MDIYTYKSTLDRLIKPAPDQTLVNVGQAWEYLKRGIAEPIDGEDYEELGFSVSTALYNKNEAHLINVDQFELYIGRLIDAGGGCRWRTAEINFYYIYKMNPELRSLLEKIQNPEIEVAYTITDDKEDIYKKIDSFIGFVDSKEAVFKIIRGLIPIKSSYSFWLT